jgi:hypothetical protein
MKQIKKSPGNKYICLLGWTKFLKFSLTIISYKYVLSHLNSSFRQLP